MANADELRIFVAQGCGHCGDLKLALEEDRVEFVGVERLPEDVEIVDVTADEGWLFMDSLDIETIPAAYIGDKACRIYNNKAETGFIVDCSPKEKNG